jgi:hypothetical protein
VWQEGREEEGRSMSAIVKQRKTGVGECYLKTREGSPHPAETRARLVNIYLMWGRLSKTRF